MNSITHVCDILDRLLNLDTNTIISGVTGLIDVQCVFDDVVHVVHNTCRFVVYVSCLSHV